MEVTSLEKSLARQRAETLAAVQTRLGERVSLEDFLSFEPEIPGIKLEWNNGQVELEYLMKADERKLIDRIIRKFNSTQAYLEGNSLLPEADVHLTTVNSLRRPDVCYFTKQQIENPKDAPDASVWVIEVISLSNTVVEIDEKLTEYFTVGVQVVWVIYPRTRRIHVYTDAKTVKIFSDNDICSAAPAVPELAMSVNEIFV